MRRLAIVCVVLAGAGLARAQPQPAPTPDATPVVTEPPPPNPPSSGSAPVAPPSPVPVPPVPTTSVDRALAEQRCASRDPGCDWMATLGSLERQSLARAIAARGYEIEPAPWGKVITRVRVFNEDVFSEGNRVLRFFNHFHVTTRERAILDEVVVQAGEVWTQDRIEETARALRDPLWSSVIVVVPVKSSEPGKVDVLVVTRDVWSLRLNTKYTYQEGKLTNLAISLSENNFFGTRNLVAASVLMDQGAIAVGPVFLDSNVAGKHVALSARVDEILSRDDLLVGGKLHSEGTDSTIAVSKTLWSLASEWAYGASFGHRFAIDRQFTGTALRQVRCPIGEACVRTIDATTPDSEKFPVIYSMRRWNTKLYMERQFGTDIKQQITIGHTIDSVRPQLLGDFAGTADQAAAFTAAVLPRSELTSVPFIAYTVFTPRFRTRRNVQTYDLAEDLRLGPSLDASFGVGLRLLGSDANFERAGLSGSWTLPWCRDGSLTGSSGITGRLLGGKFIDNTASVSARLVAPSTTYGRLVAEATLATRWNDTQNSFYGVGGDPSLRGFVINQFIGFRVFNAQVEARSRSWPVWVVRMGGVAFYDIGGAGDTLATMAPHHDIGVGFRMLIPQTSRELFRFDFPIPLDGPNAGRPRFIASFDQAF